RPPTTERVVALNRGPWVAKRPPLEELSDPAETTVLDVRPVEVFAAGHLPGAISVALDGGSFATRTAFVLDAAEPVAIHARSRAEAEEAERLLEAVGLFETAGYLLDPAGATKETTSVTIPEFERLRDGVQVLDVREDEERRETPLPVAIELAYREVRFAPPSDVDPSRPVYV